MTVYEFGPFQFDAGDGLLLRDGTPVVLTPKSLDMLRVLVENRGRLLHKNDLMKLVWPDSFVEEGNLSHHVFAVRKALDDDKGSATYIETVPKRGYRFIAPVKEVGDTSLHRSQSATGAGSTGQTTTTTSIPAGAAARIRSLAVLPLANLSANAEQDYFAGSMTEALIADLATIGRLRVASRTSSMRYTRTQKAPAEIARELDVDGLIEGSVLRVGDRVRITVQLIHAATDAHVWANSYDGAVGDVLAIQREVARAIAQEVDIALSPHERNRLAPGRRIDTKALEAYLRGRYHYGKATEDGFLKAVEQLRTAVDADSTFAQAHAALADTYIALAAIGTMPPREAFSFAKAEALAALQTDKDLADADRVMGLVHMCYDWDWAAAGAAFRRALTSTGASAETRWQYSLCLAARGRFAEAVAQAERARALDPLSLMINNDLAFALWIARRHSEAIEQYRRTLELEPHFAEARRELGLIYAQTGHFDAAVAQLEKAAALGQENETLAYLGYTQALAGRRAEAERVLAELRRRSERRYVSPLMSGLVQMGLRDHDGAFVSLGHALDNRCPTMIFLASWPIFDAIRSDPRYQGMVSRMGLGGPGE
jgi:TolB-like protein/Tfp pilus assembly protein PilF